MTEIEDLITDRCPKGCRTLSRPYRVEWPDGGIRGFYRCPSCLWSWWTGWSRQFVLGGE